MIARYIIFLTACLSILTIVAGKTVKYDPSRNYEFKARGSNTHVVYYAKQARGAHRTAAKLHEEAARLHTDPDDRKQHERASQAHTRKADKFDAISEKHEKEGDGPYSSNEHAFGVHHANWACVDEYSSSFKHADHTVTLLKKGYHQEALDRAPL